MRKIIAFTKYSSKGPSSRYRTFQFIPYWQKNGYTIDLNILFNDDYVNRLYKGKSKNLFSIIFLYVKRICKIILLKNKGQIIWIEYELLPFVPSVLEKWLVWRKFKMVLDYDDAIFHFYDRSSNYFVANFLGSKIKNIVSLANHVVTGSPYLTQYVLKNQSNVTEIPTSINYLNYENKKYEKLENKEDFIICWIGSKSTSYNILHIKKGLELFFEKYKAIIHLIGFEKKLEEKLGSINFKIIDWNEDTEIDEIKKCSVGIMPLENTDFNKGKCGFKLIQYMACGIPTISSPLETNVKINRNYKNLHATSPEEWFQQLEKIFLNRKNFTEIGNENKIIAKEFYNTENNYLKYLQIFGSL